MLIESRCANPKCGKRYTVADSFAGKSVKCKACGESFTVARAEDSVHEPAWDDAPKPKPVLSSPTIPPNSTIGRFVVREKVGAGAFGTVYRAHDPHLDREVALKVPNPGVMSDPNRAERFLREAQIAARLWHQHIVPVFDAGKDGEQFYIATAFVAGKPLSDGIPESGTEFARAARLARELAEALACAHEKGIVHRDVKPQNVMIDKADRVLLMDFGLAALQHEEVTRLTQDGAILGTPSYMAPEQARGQSAEVTPAADQYAVGVVLYELLTGEVPFKGRANVILHHVLHTEPGPPSARRPDVPADLEAICLKAMSKRPEGRHASCAALADELRRWQERAAAAPPASAALRADSKLPRPWAVVARLLCVVALVALAVSAETSAPKPPRVPSRPLLTAKDYWNAGKKAKALLTINHDKTVSSAAFSPDGTRIVTGCDDKIARVWDAKSGKERRALEGHTGTILSVAFSPDGARRHRECRQHSESVGRRHRKRTAHAHGAHGERVVRVVQHRRHSHCYRQ
jgi:serine/threonine protein kinase